MSTSAFIILRLRTLRIRNTGTLFGLNLDPLRAICLMLRCQQACKVITCTSEFYPQAIHSLEGLLHRLPRRENIAHRETLIVSKSYGVCKPSAQNLAA